MEEVISPVRRTLVVHDIARLRAALEFQRDEAPRIDYHDSLMKQIAYLLTGNYSGADELHLTRDSAPHSFGFEFRKNGHPVSLTGAVIMHGRGQPFAVTLDDGPPRIFWSIHT